MAEFYLDNTYLTDLQVGDKVIEHHKPTGAEYVSTVKSIDNNFIVVTRELSKKDITYGTRSGMIVYPYGTKVADFYLLQYNYSTDRSPYKHYDSAEDDAEELIPVYGQ